MPLFLQIKQVTASSFSAAVQYFCSKETETSYLCIGYLMHSNFVLYELFISVKSHKLSKKQVCDRPNEFFIALENANCNGRP